MKITPITADQGAATPKGMTISSVGADALKERAIVKLMAESPEFRRASKVTSNELPLAPHVELSEQEKQHLGISSDKFDNSVEPVSEKSEPSEVTEAPKPVEQAAKPSAVDPKLSSQYAILARKERALREAKIAQESALKAKEAELAAREEALKSRDVDYSTKYVDKSRLTSDPFGVLSEAGLTYDQLTELALKAPQSNYSLSKDPAYNELMNKVKSLESENQKIKQSFEEREKINTEQAMNNIKYDVEMAIGDSDEFELIRETDSIGAVVDYIKDKFDEKGILLTAYQAAKQIEDNLFNHYSKLSKLKKLQQSKVADTTAQQSSAQSNVSKSTPSKTLTNSVSSKSPGKISPRDRAVLAVQQAMNKAS